MKKFLNQNVSGQIAVPFIIGVVIAAVTGTFTAITYVQSQVQPLQAQNLTTQEELANISTNLTWIKAALIAKNITPAQNGN